MKFCEIQKKVSNLYQNPKASIAEYLSVAKALGDTNSNDIPFYVRTIKAAFLGSYTIQGLPEACMARAVFHNLRMATYLAPYNQFTQESINAQSGLVAFEPDIIFVALDTPEIMNAGHLETVIRGLLAHTHAKIIFFNFISSSQIPNARVKDLNGTLADLTQHEQRVGVFDFAGFLDHVGADEHWYTKYKELGDLRLMPAAFVPLSEELMNYVVARAGNTKKCLALDLDNTLWKGIIGEDGMVGIVPDRAIQEYILALYQKGIILAVNSKNNSEDAREVFERHPDMILKEHHIAAWRVNWQEKERNIAEIAEELDVGTDSFVFVDDSGFEQDRVRTAFPEIAVLPPELLASFSGFHSFNITSEDTQRGAMYVEERKRKEFRGSLPSEDEFLSELGLSLMIRQCVEDDIPRVSQLTQKTNQFNVATRRYTQEDIRARAQNNAWKIWLVEAKDRFGDYGIIGIAMVERVGDTARIDNFLLSCRILGRRVEEVFLHTVLDDARKNGADQVTAEFIPSAKNKLCASFFADNKFVLASSGEKQFVYHWTPQSEPYCYPHFIQLMRA